MGFGVQVLYYEMSTPPNKVLHYKMSTPTKQGNVESLQDSLCRLVSFSSSLNLKLVLSRPLSLSAFVASPKP